MEGTKQPSRSELLSIRFGERGPDPAVIAEAMTQNLFGPPSPPTHDIFRCIDLR